MHGSGSLQGNERNSRQALTRPRLQGDPEDDLIPCQEALAAVLIVNLTRRSGNPYVGVLADRLLASLFAQFGGLIWSKRVLNSLLEMVSVEEAQVLADVTHVPALQWLRKV